MPFSTHSVRLFVRGFLHLAPKLLLIFLIAHAVFAYGITRVSTRNYFNQVAFAAFVLFLIDSVVKRRWPRLPLIPLFCLVLLNLQGWWMTFNAHTFHLYNGGMEFIRMWGNPFFHQLPGSIDRAISLDFMLNFTAITGLLVVFFAMDNRWRVRVLGSFVVVASVFSVAGIMVKLIGPDAQELFWGRQLKNTKTIFFTYRYHANAATFLYLGLSVSLGFVWSSFLGKANELVRAGWILSALIIASAIMMNTSRGGWAIGLAVIVLSALWAGILFSRNRTANPDSGITGLKRSLAITCFAAAVAAPFYLSWQSRSARIEDSIVQIQDRYPKQLFNAMVKDTPREGFGPGTFSLAFLPYGQTYPDLLPTGSQHLFWNAAHQDYYQTFFEWGKTGSALWAVLIVVGLFGKPGVLNPLAIGSAARASVFRVSVLAGLLGYLVHSLYDFPFNTPSLFFFFLLLLAFGYTDPESSSKSHSEVQGE